jgi:tRNA dimethylallyltransferase
MSSQKIPLLAIIGPTAVGKTELSIGLAKNLNAEIISVDSRQVYRYLDVGTDKISFDIRREILHHLIDVVDPDQIYSAANFAADASDAAERIRARGRTPLLVGGTPFYYRALEGALSENLPSDADVRAELEAEIEANGLQALHDELAQADPVSANKIHPNDPVRTMRAMEIYRLTGKTATWWYENQKKMESPYDILYIGLNRDRKKLYEKIERRVREQFENGYPEEVEWLLRQGYSPKLPALQGFGYRELVAYVTGNCSYDEALQGDVRSTKTFSRRQMTWFKHFEPSVWYDLDEISAAEALSSMADKCIGHLERYE